MESRFCPNPNCGDELTQHHSEGFLNFYCSGCGHESKEPCSPPRKGPVADIVPFRNPTPKKQPREKIKIMRDREDYVSKRGGGRR